MLFLVMTQCRVRDSRRLIVSGLGLGLLLLTPREAAADAGIPMLPIAYPIILILLIPVIAIETIYLHARLKTNWRMTLSATAKANLVTMLLGYPLGWLLSLGLELLFWAGLASTGAGDRLDKIPQNIVVKMAGIAISAPWDGTSRGAVGDPFRVRSSPDPVFYTFRICRVSNNQAL